MPDLDEGSSPRRLEDDIDPHHTPAEEINSHDTQTTTTDSIRNRTRAHLSLKHIEFSELALKIFEEIDDLFEGQEIINVQDYGFSMSESEGEENDGELRDSNPGPLNTASIKRRNRRENYSRKRRKIEEKKEEIEPEKLKPINNFTKEQSWILAAQMRDHVQMLVQVKIFIF